MDLSDLLNAMSKLSFLKGEDSAIVSSTKRTQFLATYRQQTFPFRASIIRYIAENPTSSKLYQKIIKTCKFFFLQNPIIVLSDLNYTGYEWQNCAKIDFFAQNFVIIALDVVHVDTKRHAVNEKWNPCPNLAKIMSKLWITNSIILKPFEIKTKRFLVESILNENVISSIIPKLFRFDAKELRIESQDIHFNDFICLTSSAEKISLNFCTVWNENGNVLPLEKLVKVASNAKVIILLYDKVVSNITSETFDELLKLQNFHEIDAISLSFIPERFDIEAFYTYMKKNKHTFFDLEFNAFCSEAYKVRLEEIIDEILAIENPDYRIPIIKFSRLDHGKLSKLLSKAHI